MCTYFILKLNQKLKRTFFIQLCVDMRERHRMLDNIVTQLFTVLYKRSFRISNCYTVNLDSI